MEHISEQNTKISSLWKYLPLPDEPDRHEEWDSRKGVSPEGYRILGARVRGKKHKHEGTHCDDWFDFTTSGRWTIFALSDGAGSCKFSRVGARVSCEAVTRFLAETLKDHTMDGCRLWNAEPLSREEEQDPYAEESIHTVQTALYESMEYAYSKVVEAFEQRRDLGEYRDLLGGREPTLYDFSSTLLVALHTSLMHEGELKSFVMACQIGDGMTALIDMEGNLKLLGIPDSGTFSGETDFLTSKEKISPANLVRKTVSHFGSMRALMTMSDGVSDDYFPHSPGVLRLFGDLALNEIITPCDTDGSKRETRLSEAKTATPDTLEEADYSSIAETMTPQGVKRVSIRSCEKYRELLGVSLSSLAKHPTLLQAGRPQIHDTRDEAEKLLNWLDSYYVRGSFDDRTLLMLYC